MRLFGMVLMELMEQYLVDNIEEHFQGNQHLLLPRLLLHHIIMQVQQLFILPVINLNFYVFSFIIFQILLIHLQLLHLALNHILHLLLHTLPFLIILILVFIFPPLTYFRILIVLLLRVLHLLPIISLDLQVLLIQLLILLIFSIFLTTSFLFLRPLIITAQQDEPLQLHVESYLLNLQVPIMPFNVNIIPLLIFNVPFPFMLIIIRVMITTTSSFPSLDLHYLLVQLSDQLFSSFSFSSFFVDSCQFLHPFKLENLVNDSCSFHPFIMDVLVDAFLDITVKELIVKHIINFIQDLLNHLDRLIHFHLFLCYSTLLVIVTFHPLLLKPQVTKIIIYQKFLFPYIYFMLTIEYQDHHNHYFSLMDYKTDQNYEYHGHHDLNSFNQESQDLYVLLLQPKLP